MSKIRTSESEYIDMVWAKVRYLEYEKHVEETIKKNNKELLARRLKYLFLLALVPVFAAMAVVMLSRYDTGVVYAVGIILLGCGSLYEYLSEKEIYRRT